MCGIIIGKMNYFERAKYFRTKKRLGLSLDTRFFATGHLIESLQLFVKIRGNNTWKTDKGLLV